MAEINRQAALIGLSWGLGTLVIIFSGARLWARTMIKAQASWDDIFMTLAAIFAILCSVFVTIAAHYGLGKRIDTITDPYYREEAIKYTVIAPTVSIVSSTLSKISILIFLTRLMGIAATRRHLICLWTLGAILFILNLLAIIIILRFCSPIEKQWKPQTEGRCMSPAVNFYTGVIPSAYTAFMDIVLAIFPSLIIAKLNINRKMKIGLSCLMGGSIFAAGATIVKIYFMHADNLGDHHDITRSWANISILYICEVRPKFLLKVAKFYFIPS
ncbi:hypothetical protein F4774DRAFT_425486 [Daldinia eschscholtzii]|nr:hypothetical protein F4774DRAFT_425486 [Daldinia eschscholtzii]